MAYNPFDDVIEQDPAYMQIGGAAGLARQNLPDYDQKAEEAAKKSAQQIGSLMAPVYQALTPEKELLEQKQQQEELNDATTTNSTTATTNDTETTQSARIVQRRESTPGGSGTKLILNVMLRKECVVEKRGEKFVKLAAFEVVDNTDDKKEEEAEASSNDNGAGVCAGKNSVKLQTVQYLFKVKTVNDADSLLDALKTFCK